MARRAVPRTCRVFCVLEWKGEVTTTVWDESGCVEACWGVYLCECKG